MFLTWSNPRWHRASAWLDKTCLERGVPPDEISRLDVCLNEASENIVIYGGTSALSFPICLHLDVCRDQSASLAIVTISDAGAAFDPLAASPKPRAGALAEAESGGLGLLVIHSFSGNLSYRYSEGRNQLTFSQRWIGVR